MMRKFKPDEHYEDIMERAFALQHAHERARGGARSQTITIWDNLDVFIMIAMTEFYET